MGEETSTQKTEWEPKTTVGKLVKEGTINSIYQLYSLNLPILEPEIVDILVPNLKNEVVYVSIVQKQTDAGEQSRFKVAVIVGNEDGLVGIGTAKAKQLRFAIDKAIEDAKLKIIPVNRGCGSWECSCNRPHSIPFKVVGKSGSVEITLKPAPRGVGLVAGDPAKVVLRLAGIQDIWSFTRGETRTTLNFIMATYNALKNTNRFRFGWRSA
ncbi:MAG: 30S ribosomal protein S5 [archaeon YNP-LCB-003-016]|uniref:30S ribosomal protein S5 n=1 Tax=Candidatus Culexarchaeum yellowstonense TaxID=2928963 RepID=UPI0026EDE028|nr:30S ribosomal protein S5 [Candidatus Culexarchaeum yellowstonense]MCC6017451.1 30S ribosomal protein S5 [Candidatus Verstraetearchaeota archaeon]MCR6691251.1 30S ribosomal protein S5 [Candidatus Culexarchaeum yellowstonense]